MGNKTSRGMTYEQYYEFLKSQNGGSVAGININLDGLDPYEVLGVRKKFTWDELKDAYRGKAKMVHPDKGGSEELFNVITACFKQLAHEYKMNLEAKSHFDMKKESQNYYAQHVTKPVTTRRSRGDDDDGDFNEKFNRMFEDNKLKDDEDEVGYGHLMEKSNGKREDIDVPNILGKSKKFNTERFNKAFDKVTPLSKDVVVYKEPQPLVLAKSMAYTELGGKTDDFSSSVEKGERGLQYTDYMKAHTTSRLVDPRAVSNRKDYRNVEEYDAARTRAVEKEATEDEKRWMREREEVEERREYDRLQRLKQRDEAIASHFERVNGLLMR